MINYNSEGTVTGQVFRVKAVQTVATAIPMPVVKGEDLNNKDHPINIKHLSGKQKGAMVALEKEKNNLQIAIACGSEPTDKWYITTMEDNTVTPVKVS